MPTRTPGSKPASSSERHSPRPAPRLRAGGRPRGPEGKTRTFDAVPDRIDIRDWIYRPNLVALPDQIVNCDAVPAILDQGREGACTGFALAAVIQYLLRARGIRMLVSPRMLYEMARRYDEWPGDGYEGSSARGAMMGWVRHGVCSEKSWPKERAGLEHFRPEVVEEARKIPGGAFYRVMHRQVRDMHAALAEVGALYCTLMVHKGWQEPGPARVTVAHRGKRRTLPVIRRKDRATDGHAVVLVGYTTDGFIVQNSWGESWGDGGFALLPYEDFLLHSTDVWAAQLGVPVTIDLWVEQGQADSTAGIQRATPAVPLADIRPYVVDLGNNGELSRSGDYWTTEADIERLFTKLIPERAGKWSRRRVLLYLHGGLNDEKAVARRIVAFRDVLLDNEIYPVHIMWESGVFESLKAMIADRFTDVDDRAGGVRDWVRHLRDGLLDAKDWTFEQTVARPGSALWSEMKENARLASDPGRSSAGMQILLKHARRALEGLGDGARKSWELHVVGHSAGSIFAAHALTFLEALDISFRTIQFMAPGIRVDDFKRLVLPRVLGGSCPLPTLYVLSDRAELADTVGPYGRSLLYLVSNAFEGRRGTPILGMERYVALRPAGGGGRFPEPDGNLATLFGGTVDGRPALVVSGQEGSAGSLSRSRSHGGFDNDPDTLNSVLLRILGRRPSRPFTKRDLEY